MTDDPNRRHVDGWFVSSQPHEYSYFLRQMEAEFPRSSEEKVAQAIFECRKQISPSEGREKLKVCVRNKLKS